MKFSEHLEKIHEINPLLGLSRVFGNEEAYFDSVNLMAQSICPICANINTLINNKDSEGYRIELHGLKGSFLNIGAVLLSNEAKALETASVKGDFDYCKTNTQQFIKKITLFYEDLETAIKEWNEKLTTERNEKNFLPVDDCFFNNISEMREALEDFDIETAQNLVSKLLEYNISAENRNTMQCISESLKSYDFDTASKELAKIK